MSNIEHERLYLPIDVVEPQVKDLVAEGGLLSSEIVRQWSAHAIWTPAPPGTEVQDLTEVTRGGLKEPSRLSPLVGSFIRTFLETDRAQLAIFEDAVARAGDAVLKDAKSPYALIEDQVFPFLAGGRHSDDAVKDLLMEAWSWRLVGVLTRSESEPTDHRLDVDLATLVAHSMHLVVGAWDGEGLLVVDRIPAPSYESAESG